jgi:nucleoside 2-deoxyribosyltransferase
MQFFQKMEELKLKLEKLGYSVYLPEAEESEGFYLSLPAKDKPAMKRRFIDAHVEKIKKSNGVLIANFRKHEIDGYVGPNTLMEIAFAYALGKDIYMLNAMEDQPCKDEVLGLGVEWLDGELNLFS